MLTVTCPTCRELVIIEKINCGIFRHGVNKKTGKQINPHLEKTKCESLVSKGKIFGCGKPFRIVDNEAVVCDYI